MAEYSVDPDQMCTRVADDIGTTPLRVNDMLDASLSNLDYDGLDEIRKSLTSKEKECLYRMWRNNQASEPATEYILTDVIHTLTNLESHIENVNAELLFNERSH